MAAAALSKPLAVFLIIVSFIAVTGILFSLEAPSQGEGYGLVSGSLIGAGSSFLNPQMQAWAIQYYELSEGRVRVNYQSLGSGAGQAKFREGMLDFVGSDPPLKHKIYVELSSRDGVLQFPIIVGGVAVVYNIPEIGDMELKLTGEVIAKIYLAEILFWDDEEIRKLNPDLNLPHEKIIAVHRSDGSGTTKIFTAYLSSVSSEWAEEVGADFTVQWPVDSVGNGLGGKGNEGVAAAVSQNKYSIGYVELAYVKSANLKAAKLMNRDGFFVLPTSETLKAAIKEASLTLPNPDEDWSGIIDKVVNQPGENSYPITSFSFIILRKTYDPVKAELVKEFFGWVLTEGEKPENVLEGYVPLPPEAAQIGLKALEMIKEV